MSGRSEDQGSAGPVRIARIVELAAPFCARTTTGERSLADYRGRRLLLFSHALDFAPVCASEFIAFAKAAASRAAGSA